MFVPKDFLQHRFVAQIHAKLKSACAPEFASRIYLQVQHILFIIIIIKLFGKNSGCLGDCKKKI